MPICAFFTGKFKNVIRWRRFLNLKTRIDYGLGASQSLTVCLEREKMEERWIG